MAADFDLLFLVNTPGMYYYQARNPQQPRRISSQARSHAAMAFHRKRHGAVQVKAFETRAAGLGGGRKLLPKPSMGSGRKLYEEEEEEEEVAEEDTITNTPNTTTTSTTTTTTSRQELVRVRDTYSSPLHRFEPQSPPPSRAVDILPGVPHRDSPGFPAAAEFYSTVRPDLVHAPVFHIFDVSNTFAKSYYDLMTHEVALHAGVAVVNMVRDVFRSNSRGGSNNNNARNNKRPPSAEVLRLVQVALSKLRQHMAAQDEDPGGGGGGEDRDRSPGGRRRFRQRDVNDDGVIIAALFLGHIASAFGDLEAFQMHRRGIKTMVESRGGLDVLGLDGMLKCSVLQFESWWTHIYRDTSVFASSKPPYNPVYLCPPFSAETVSLLSKLPPGFRCLATQGKLAVDIVTVLSNIASYQDAIRSRPDGVARQMESVASLPARRRHTDFSDACTCLLDPAPNFEKYLVFALICYASVAFSPDRHYLSASHTAFRTPRLLLTQDLPAFRVEEPAVRDGNAPTNQAGDTTTTTTTTAQMDCLVWMWLVLVNSWTATDGADSENAVSLKRVFREKCPEDCDSDRLDRVLSQFFWTAALKAEMNEVLDGS
ncbi:hypothetical protein CLAIMM_10695 [Cladophialophora immunda]|nr:hypothetical protein CLAIMM_10695 [Cladophialophora immunda]